MQYASQICGPHRYAFELPIFPSGEGEWGMAQLGTGLMVNMPLFTLYIKTQMK